MSRERKDYNLIVHGGKGQKSKLTALIAVVFGIVLLSLSGCPNSWMEDILKPLIDRENTDGITFFTVTFDSNGGSLVESQQVAEGEKAVRPTPNPTKSENDIIFGFMNWYDNEELDDPHYDFDTPVTADITLYAKWNDITCEVTFNRNDGSDFEKHVVGEGGTVSEPDAPERHFDIIAGLYLGNPEDALYYKFLGWYDADDKLYDFDTPVIENITLTAKWDEPESRISEVEGNDVAEAVTYVNKHPETYTLLIGANVEADAQTLSAGNLTIIGIESERTITANSTYLFTVQNSANLTLGENITLSSTNNSYEYPLVSVATGKLTMLDGSKITNYNNSSELTSYAGVIHLSGGSFTMEGGEISGNTAVGVYMLTGTFNMNGGIISENEATNGGGVYVVYSTGIFNMNGGTISGNEATNGGGVFVYSGTFNMTGGEIFENNAYNGGGVYVNNSGTFTMTGGEISGNKVSSAPEDDSNTTSRGGGVYLNSGNFTMDGGMISGNKNVHSGGGVYVKGGFFSMKSGTISGNNAYNGGGVYVNNSGTFTMTGGEISGNEAPNGGGVSVGDTGTFNMNNGTISDNEAGLGGGVAVGNNGIFSMNGGEILNNNANYGGGVCVAGPFTMKGGTITGNTAPSGGGVYVDNDGIFTMDSGTISSNIADNNEADEDHDGNGGGVFVNGTFTMNSGTISNNTSVGAGGGVFVNMGIFTMMDGVISGNKAVIGGGVFVFGTFRIFQGTIYGSNATPSSLSNTALGTALFLMSTGGFAQYAQYGTFIDNIWSGTDIEVDDNGYYDNTIRVLNGVFDP
ncbi:MAG: InlB B-repeat-containing protein [Treponema sp.]|jgi:hypothetical protein|nr:InlB B-repeat-containing protein [Treponema sp.]